MSEMPKKGLYGFLVFLGFLCGVIWGALSFGPYNKMKNAINDGDADTAWENAKKIRMFVIIGVVINVFFILIRLGQR